MSSRKDQIMAYVERMSDKERRALLSQLKKHEEARSEPETGELPEKGAALVSSCMERRSSSDFSASMLMIYSRTLLLR